MPLSGMSLDPHYPRSYPGDKLMISVDYLDDVRVVIII